MLGGEEVMRVPRWIVPVLVVAAAAAGIGGARLFAAPSVVREFAIAAPESAPRRVVFLIEGVRCVDTAERAAAQLEDVPGVVRFTAWAPRARVEVTYDPAVTDASELKDAIEGPVYNEVTGEFLFGVFAVREMDGVEVREDPR